MRLGLGIGIDKLNIAAISGGLRARFLGTGAQYTQLGPITRQLTAAMTGTGTQTTDLLVTKRFAPNYTGDGTMVASFVSFDADYQAVLDYATTQGYTLPSEAQQDLQNQLVLDLKTDLIWSELDSFGVFASDGNSSFARIDWIRLVTMSEVNSPTFTTNKGYNGDGATSYIDTGFSPSTHGSNFTQNDASWFAWAEGANSTGQFWVGQADGRNGVRLATSDAQRINSASNASSSVGISSTLSKSNVLFSRSDSSNFEIDVTDTVTEVNTNYARTATSTALTSGNFLIGSWFGAYANAQCSFFGTGSNLSSKRLDLFNALKTYYTAL